MVTIKNTWLLLAALLLPLTAHAQRTIHMRTAWTRPQVKVLFQGYVVAFTIRDIDKALALLAETGDKTFGASCHLDTAGNYATELYARRMQYHNSLQPLMQQGVGAFLLLAGHGVVINPKHKLLKDITADVGIAPNGEPDVLINFYDPKTNKMIFSGKMKVDMYNKDLGIDGD